MLFDLLPIELLHQIAHYDEPTYYALVHAYPRFARSVTNGVRVDYRVSFGHDVQIRAVTRFLRELECVYTRNGLFHRLDGPAVEGIYNYSYYVNGVNTRYGAPCYHGDDLIVWKWNDNIHRGIENDPCHNPENPKPSTARIWESSHYGIINIEYSWLQHDCYHNVAGPAYLIYETCELFNIILYEIHRGYAVCGGFIDPWWFHILTMEG